MNYLILAETEFFALINGAGNGNNMEAAYNGFVEARQNESFPMCGMDEVTIDFLLAELAYRFKKYDVASRMVASILTSVSANARTKDKARDLKDRILADLKKKQ